MNINIYYLIIIIPIILAYIIYRLKNAHPMRNQQFIASIVLDMLEDKDYTTQLQEKEKELTDKNNMLEQAKQNLEKEKEITNQKILESTRDLKEEHTRLVSAIDNLGFGFIMTDKEKNIIMINKIAKTNLKIQDPLKNIQVNNKLVDIFISPQPFGTVTLIEDKTEEKLIEQSRKNFPTVVSHELRAPLTNIKEYLSLIKQDHYKNIKDEKLKKMINEIDSSNTRLINIVNDFLETSKHEREKINFHPEETDLTSIVASSIKETESIATEKKLSIEFNTSEQNAKVFADKEKLKQVTINLISNAIKYTDQGKITINIQNSPDKYYKVTIKDTGRGIPQENVKFLFSKFQQNDPNKPVNVVSSGLGLYITKLLVEKMNGQIQLEKTEVNKGSTFSFSLPIYEKTNH